LLAWCGALAPLAGCASVPVESVQLSEAVGRDLESLHVAHKELAVRYFQRMHRDVDEFVDEVYRPYVIRSTMEDLGLIAKLQASLQPGSALDPLDVMEIYVEEAMKQIEVYRAELQAPVTEQEVQVLGAIDASHLRVQNANSIVTGHLAGAEGTDAGSSCDGAAEGLPERTAAFATSASTSWAALSSAKATDAT
jgi:hypothetical protein